jgi:hypothetical protein
MPKGRPLGRSDTVGKDRFDVPGSVQARALLSRHPTAYPITPVNLPR